MILLLGAGYDSNTSFHLTESMLPAMLLKQEGAPILVNENRKWVEYRDFAYDADDFERIGTALESSHPIVKGKVGASTSRLFSQRRAVDFALDWMKAHRT